MELFEKWLESSLFNWPFPGRSLLAISSMESGNRGLKCLGSVEAGSCILAIPIYDFRLVLTPLRCLTFLNMCGCFHSAPHSFLSDPVYCLVLFLFHICRPINRECPIVRIWQPYLLVLPTHFSCPVFLFSTNASLYERFFGDRDSTSLVGCNDLKFTIRKTLEDLKRAWINVLPITNHTSALPPTEFVWAWCAVNSRCVHCILPEHEATKLIPACASVLGVPTENYQQIVKLLSKSSHPTLIPFFDLINHSPEATTKLVVDVECKVLRLFSDQALSSDEQVLLNYGPHDNSTLFTDYGFCLQPGMNPHEAVYPTYSDLISLSELVGSSPNRLATVLDTLLNHLDLPVHHLNKSSSSWPTVYINKDGPSYQLIHLLYTASRHNSIPNDDSKRSDICVYVHLLDEDTMINNIQPLTSKLTARLRNQISADQTFVESIVSNDSLVLSFLHQLLILLESKKQILA